MKPAEFRKLTLEELRSKEKDLKEELFLFRLRHAIKDPEDTMKIKNLKKDVARVLTIIKEKENEQVGAASTGSVNSVSWYDSCSAPVP